MAALRRGDTPVPDDEFFDVFVAALQADDDKEAVYGWMAEESEPERASVVCTD